MEAPSSTTTYTVEPIGSQPDSPALFVDVDKPVRVSNSLYRRAEVLEKADLLPLAREHHRRAKEEAAKQNYNLFTDEEYALWCAYLPDVTDTEFASEMPDGASARLKDAVELDCFDGFVVRQHGSTGEVMIIGYLYSGLYFPVTFWAPAEVAPVTAEVLRTTLQEQREREARQEADRVERKAADDRAAQIEKGKATRLSRITWAIAGLTLVVLAIGFLWVLGWWGLLPVAIMGAAATWIWDGVRTPFNLYNVRRFLVKPLVILGVVSAIVLGLVYAQFGTTSRVITVCGPGQNLDVQTYETLDGTEYEFTQEAHDQFYRDDPSNQWGYGRVTAEVEHRFLFGLPRVTSLKHTSDNNSEEVRATCAE